MSDFEGMDKEAFKAKLGEFFDINEEIKKASPLLNELKKKRKALGDEIMGWMDMHKMRRARLGGKGVIEKRITKRKAALNAGFIQRMLEERGTQPDVAADMTRSIFDNREETETSYIKIAREKEDSVE